MKEHILGLVRRLGYHVYRVPSIATDGPAYESIHPLASYAPWRLDADFRDVYEKIKGDTLVDLYRCWELWHLVAQSAKSRGALLEVGVWRGGTGAILARAALACGIDDPVYLCDTFAGVVKATDQDSRYTGGEHSDTSRARVEKLLVHDLGLDNVHILEGVFPEETARSIPDTQRFRLCHIDVDVYQSAKDVLAWVWPKMDVGAIVVFDDYGHLGCDGVVRLVDECAGDADRIFLYNLNGHAVLIKIAAGA